MSEFLSKLTGMANTTVIPMIFQYIEKNEPQLEEAIVKKLYEIRTTNPAEYNIFITNFRKICTAVEKSYTYTPPPIVPTPPIPNTAPATGGFLGFGESGPSGPSGQTIVEQVTNFFKPSGPSGSTGPIEAPTVPTEIATGPTGPIEAPTVPTEIATGPTGPIGETPVSTESDIGGRKKRHKRKTAKQHRKRTHRVKHKKH